VCRPEPGGSAGAVQGLNCCQTLSPARYIGCHMFEIITVSLTW
jgi:hypothetical protein